MTARSLAEQALELAKEALVLTEHATIRMSAKEIVVLAERCLALEAVAEAARERLAAEDEGRVPHQIHRDWDCPCCKAHDDERAALVALDETEPA